MSERGTFTVGSHSHDLHYKVGEKNDAEPVFLAAHDGRHAFDGFADYRDLVLDDLERSRHLITRFVGRAPRYFAWPYGHSEPSLDLLAREAGYHRTLLLEAGMNHTFVSTDRNSLPLVDRIPIRRYTITARTSLRTFQEMVTGEYVPPDASY
jgi:peptidoglycan/xylan/chitin deacetylase (PgdA/CDA1 family)